MILAYIGKEIDRDALIKIFVEQNIQYKELFDSDLHTRLGVLLKREEQSVEMENSRNSFLLFSNVSDDEMSMLRSKMKEEKIFIPRIAMETEHNVHWELSDLLDAIDEEVEFFKLRDAVIEKLKKPNFNRIRKDPSYIKTISDMIDRISSDDISLKEMQEFYKYLYKI